MIGVIAHGLSSTGFSGEGEVYRASLEALEEAGIDYFSISFSKPRNKVKNPVYLFPFPIRRFDRYQRLLVYYSAKKVRNKVSLFLNLSGFIIPLSDYAPHYIYAGRSPRGLNVSGSILKRIYQFPLHRILSTLKFEAKKAFFAANSRYSAKAISQMYEIPEPRVIYPPVDVEFYSRAFQIHEREDLFVTVGRIERNKSLENAVTISAMTGIKGVIVGSLSDRRYLKEIISKKKRMNANVDILPNLPREELLKIMGRAKAYFHPRIGEHFGIPVVESMAAGLVPVVPRESGAYEVVPEFSYSSLEEAVEQLKRAVSAEDKVRRDMHERAKPFNRSRFKAEILSWLREGVGANL
ncbi:glycosyltransferase [Acidianus sp. RZ1]|uniref:glycosyltransferase n=1 Tax=Acidianus sp. RZ1 TaxID=1540082 RepID=UPI0014911DAC|nr:glycosyltransferase [Acidianus sp. RZ1]NON62880.1 glycosyltransferase [Acidianus sp. RZ1]